MNNLIRLSPSTLNLFLECPRCFWLEKNKNIKRPRGIFPSLPGGMDQVIKAYFDKYRQKNELPPEAKNRLNGKLLNNLDLLNRWRSWRSTDLVYEDKKLNAILSGALDDCLVENGFYIPLDYKTRGSDFNEDPRKYYQTQLDCYCLMLESSGYRTKNLAYLLYYWPEEVLEDGLVRFKVEPLKVETNLESARKIFQQAVETLRGFIPLASSECEYCSLVKMRREEG